MSTGAPSILFLLSRVPIWVRKQLTSFQLQLRNSSTISQQASRRSDVVNYIEAKILYANALTAISMPMMKPRVGPTILFAGMVSVNLSYSGADRHTSHDMGSGLCRIECREEEE